MPLIALLYILPIFQKIIVIITIKKEFSRYLNMCKYRAEQIKAIVIDWLLEKHTDIIIGNEVMYGSKRKVVDLLAIIDGKTTAIEIKSATDKLSRLQEQVEEYSKIFDRIIVVAAPSHIVNISNIINKGIGLYSCDRSIKKVYPPLINNSQDKLEMLYSISSSFLKKHFPQYKNLKENEIRLLLSKKKKADIHQILISFYQCRLSDRFLLFLKDRGQNTLIDDIPLLSTLTLVDES